MFIKSAANDTLQGSAIQKVNENWGADFRSWVGHETIGIPVCKKKYGTFLFFVFKLALGLGLDLVSSPKGLCVTFFFI